MPVYIDGDAKGAQKLGTRFNVSGYPTMVLFTPDGREITRLPGEVEADRYMQVLALGMDGARPVQGDADGGAGGRMRPPRLRPEDWRMLAWYSWVTDEKQLVAETSAPPRSRVSPRRAPPISRRSRRACRCRRSPPPRR